MEITKDQLERKHLEVQLAQVSTARMALELSLMERMADAERIKKNIELQKIKEEELTKKLKGE